MSTQINNRTAGCCIGAQITAQKYLMMMMVMLISSLCAAQQPDDIALFRVIVCKGNTLMNGAALRPGMSVKANDTIVVEENGYVGLVHKASGKPIEIKGKGYYPGRMLDGKIQLDESPFRHPWYGKNFNKNTPKEPSPLRILNAAEGPVSVVAPAVLLMWCLDESIEMPKKYFYRISIRNMFDDELKTVSTRENNIELDLLDPAFQIEKFIIVDVSFVTADTVRYKSTAIALKRPLPGALRDLTAKLSSADTDVNHWNIVGRECIDKRFYSDAIYAFYKAYGISGNEQYKNNVIDVIKTVTGEDKCPCSGLFRFQEAKNYSVIKTATEKAEKPIVKKYTSFMPDSCSENIFKVIVAKGNVKMNGSSLKTGQSLTRCDVIVLKKNATIEVRHRSGRHLKVNNEGRYSTEDLLRRYNESFLPGTDL